MLAGLKTIATPILKEGMRVFILGAGASLHAGYPLAAQMGNCLAAWINTLPLEHQYRSSLKQIADLYGELENFESILADLMTAAPGSRAASLGVARPYLLGDLKEALRDYGFTKIQSGTHTFEDFLTRETATACADAGETNLDERPHSHSAGTLARLNALTGKQGLLKIQHAGEVGFTILSVHPAPDLLAETDDEAIQLAINRSQFLVRFDEGTLIDGSDTRVISGRYISLIRGRY